MSQLPNTKNNQKYLLGFSLLPDIGPGRFGKIIQYFSSLENAWNASVEEYISAGIGEKTSRKLVSNRSRINLEKEFSKIECDNIQILSPYFDSDDYPSQLKEISAHPFVLFCRGNTSILNKKQLAIVGTRKPSPYGIQATEKIGAEICQAGLIITSGLALGIDSIAHQTALRNNAPTIAVLGNSLDEEILKTIYSYELARKILSQNGLLVSDYPPGQTPQKFTFPARNRIISGLSLGVLVIEAGEKSGSLITANYALEQNREVFALPGTIFSSQSAGTNFLLKQGARPITGSKDILETFGFYAKTLQSQKEEVKFEDKKEEMIYKHLSLDPTHINKLSVLAKLDTPTISTTLSLMELRGIVRNVGGGNFIKWEQ